MHSSFKFIERLLALEIAKQWYARSIQSQNSKPSFYSVFPNTMQSDTCQQFLFMWSPTDLNKTLEVGKQLSKEMGKTTVWNENNNHLH